MCTAFLPCVPTSQKGAPGLIIDGCEPPCGCWELNLGPLEEQSVLLTCEPSLQLPSLFLGCDIADIDWHQHLFVYLFIYFGFSVALEPVLKLAL